MWPPRQASESKLHLLWIRPQNERYPEIPMNSRNIHQYMRFRFVRNDGEADHVLRIDLVTGERTHSVPSVFHQGRLSGVSSVSHSLALKSAASPPLKRRAAGAASERLRRDVVEMDVQSLDPVSLAPLVDLAVPTNHATFVGNEYHSLRRHRVPEGAECRVVLEQSSVGSSACDLFLKKERIVGVAATRESLIVTIADDRGIDWKPAKVRRKSNPPGFAWIVTRAS